MPTTHRQNNDSRDGLRESAGFRSARTGVAEKTSAMRMRQHAEQADAAAVLS